MRRKPTPDAGAAEPDAGNHRRSGRGRQSAVEARTEQDTSEIVVTATRRNEALSDVPLAVSAVTAETLENSGASDIRQLTQVSPSLLVSSTSSEAGAGVARIRGIGTVGDNPGLESSVAVFIDGVYRSRTGVGLTELGPIDRIEVLRGPQGTLFGRNASAGLISIITAKPKFQTEVGGELDVGNYDLRRAELSATGALSDTIAARIDGVWMKRDGFLEDVISGRDVNDRDRWLLRGQLLFEPSSDLSFRMVGDYAKRDEECCAAPYLPAHRLYARARRAAFDDRGDRARLGRASSTTITFERDVSITPGRSYRSDVKDYGLSGEVVYDFGGAELTSITAYRYNKYIRGQDADFNNLDILLPRRRRQRLQPLQDLHPGTAASGRSVRRQARLAGRRLLRQREAAGRRQPRLRRRLCALRQLPGGGQLRRAPTIRRHLVNTANPTCFNPARRGAQSVAPPAGGANSRCSRHFSRHNPAGQRGAFHQQRLHQSCDRAWRTRFHRFDAQWAALDDTYKQTSNNWALFTHNIFDITDTLEPDGRRALHAREEEAAMPISRDNNTLARFFAGGPALAACRRCPASSRAFLAACFDRIGTQDRRQAVGHGRAELEADRTAADLRQLFARL